MAPSKPAPEETPDDAQTPQSEAEKATAKVVAAAAERKAKADELALKREALEKELALVNETAVSEGLLSDAVPTHLLVLADGSRVESAGAVPTHHSTPDGRVLPVERAYSLEGMTAHA